MGWRDRDQRAGWRIVVRVNAIEADRCAGARIPDDAREWIGDGDDDDVPAAIGRVGIGPRPYRVVVIARVLWIDGDEGNFPQVRARAEREERIGLPAFPSIHAGNPSRDAALIRAAVGLAIGHHSEWELREVESYVSGIQVGELKEADVERQLAPLLGAGAQ